MDEMRPSLVLTALRPTPNSSFRIIGSAVSRGQSRTMLTQLMDHATRPKSEHATRPFVTRSLTGASSFDHDRTVSQSVGRSVGGLTLTASLRKRSSGGRNDPHVASAALLKGGGAHSGACIESDHHFCYMVFFQSVSKILFQATGWVSGTKYTLS